MGPTADPAARLMTVSEAIALAHTHWNAGQAAQAEDLCLRVLGVVADQPDARHLLGLIAHAYGHPNLALAHLRVACQAPAAPALYCSNLAEVCRQQGKLDEAEAAARRAVAADPGLAEGWNNLGIILQEAGQLAASLDCLHRVAALRPDSPQAHNNLGNTCKRMGDNPQALAHYRRALELDPDYAQVLSNMAVALGDEGRHEAALAALRRAIEIDPLLPQAHLNLAELERARPRQAPAAPDTTAMRPAPSDEHVLGEAEALLRAGRHGQAETLLRQALSQGSPQAALSRLLVQALRPQGKLQEARLALEHVLRAEPGDAGSRLELAEVLLAEGDFDAGWREYRFRYRLARTAMLARHVQKPRWDGRPIPGQTLLLHDEQGYGDTFQFLQLVALARARSGARVILEVKQPCHALARRGGLADEVIAAGSAPPAFDLHCELMSLPLVLGLRLADLPVRTAYLRADPDRLAFWRARLADLPRPRVGLVWAGRPTHPHDAQRSLALADLAPLAQPGITFIGLQQGEAAAQADTPVPGLDLVPLSREIRDFDDTAAILTLLDVLVSVDSSPVHLAGALGCPAWVLLPFAPDWRWLRDRRDSPWYPSLRLFRQPSIQAWRPALEEVAVALRALRDSAGDGPQSW
ncbi:tetratricopeptide repeat protein [Bordetella hinzii]|uniref:Tetratricopeptide repeat protein n=1 Tax=Bordetella hinzii OH87 BAL007II TaxID=1331262 RepID=A0ABR4R5Y2_9BORD|nr:tetratricopeptide repeat protein [Bordetella hinzii]KCB26099.1 tetratricopeptide repeat protein [Bordetella hinzii OH87 BAL007II]KCB29616.1 tetratricopeptide repeat protein [Bordetella hinzii CA90 BAL1384]KCB40828.1 tetratricopeptide repeat protein [Bordetella hinzii 5132]